MEYQKITNLLDNASNQSSKFRTKNWVEINDESREGYNIYSQIRFKTTLLKSSLCDYSDAYILKGTITVADTSAVNFNEANVTDSFNSKAKMTGQTDDDDGEIDNTEIMVSLKYLSNFWRTLNIPLINCEVSLILNWSENCYCVY